MTDVSISPRRAKALRAAFCARLSRGYGHLAAGDLDSALRDFEAAHILGQAHTLRHLRSHLALLRWGLRARSPREIVGQLGRMLGAALFTWLWAPKGNPGSTRVGAFSPHPVPDDLSSLLQGGVR